MFELSTAHARLHTLFVGMPRETSITVGTNRLAAGGRNTWEGEVDLKPYMGHIRILDAFNPYQDVALQVPIVVDFGNGMVLREFFPPLNVAGLVRGLFSGLPSGPIVFNNEPAHHGPPRSAILVADAHVPRVLGQAITFQDLDAIALQGPWMRIRTDHTCTFPPNETLVLERWNAEVVVYDRRTAAVLARKLFEAPPRCPDFPTRNIAVQLANSYEMETWLESLIADPRQDAGPTVKSRSAPSQQRRK